MSNWNVRRSALYSSALAKSLCFCLWNGAAEAQSQTYNFDLPSRSLSASLRQYAQVSGQQIIFTDELVAGLKAKPLHGIYSADDALSQLPAGSGSCATEPALP
jgi:hypothetical protein